MKINPTKCVIVGMGNEKTGKIVTVTEISPSKDFASGVRCKVSFDGSSAKKVHYVWLDLGLLVALR